MEALRFKVEANFEKGKTYSVCLRGARRYQKDEFDLSLYTPDFWERPKAIASIVSQKQYRFCDLTYENCLYNYDTSVRDRMDLGKAMVNVYPDFEATEIVTMLRFMIL